MIYVYDICGVILKGCKNIGKILLKIFERKWGKNGSHRQDYDICGVIFNCEQVKAS